MAQGATIEIITAAVGGGIRNEKKVEVQRVQELLMLYFHPKKPFKKADGKWTDQWSEGMLRFQTEVGKPIGWTPTDYVEPDDAHKKLTWLAFKAGVVSWVPGLFRGTQAAYRFYQGVAAQGVPYGWNLGGKPYNGGTRTVRGWKGNPFLVVYTRTGKDGLQHFTADDGIPKTLNCTSFANLMISVWMTGGAHGAPYTPGLGVGAYVPLGKEKFNMPPLKGDSAVEAKSKGLFRNLDKLKAQILPDKIYHFARYVAGFGIKHDMVLMDGHVYESTNRTHPADPSVLRTPLDEKFKKIVGKKDQYVQVHGPAAG